MSSLFWNGIEVDLGLLRDFFKVFNYIWDGEVTDGGVILQLCYPSAYLSFRVVVLSFTSVVLILGELSFSVCWGLGLVLGTLVIPASNSYCKFTVTVRWVCSSGRLFSHVEDVKLVVSTRLFGGSCYENSTICYDLLPPVSGFVFSSGIFQISTLDINSRNRSVGSWELVCHSLLCPFLIFTHQQSPTRSGNWSHWKQGIYVWLCHGYFRKRASANSQAPLGNYRGQSRCPTITFGSGQRYGTILFTEN